MSDLHLSKHDHLMQKGDGDCDEYDPLPKGKFNRGLPPGTSFWCKTCHNAPVCESDGHEVDGEVLFDMDEEEDEERAAYDRQQRNSSE